MRKASQPDYTQFVKVLRRQGRPDHLPFYEHIASGGFISRRMGVDVNTLWGEPKAFWKTYVPEPRSPAQARVPDL